ncbi:MAG TPA: ComEC/Rec2 family competence protein, partial [Dehalococcoidia bacterium]|nr:ComEC/Rec2 family competence protein [Dehalococcoidia bacterium]
MILGYLGLAWLLGIAAAAFLDADPLASLAAASLLAAITAAFRPRPRTLLLAMLGIALVLLAGWGYEATLPSPSAGGIAVYNGQDAVRFRALVDDEPEERGSSLHYQLSVRETLTAEDEWTPSSGGVLMTAAPFPRYAYGDLLELEGELKTPPRGEEFDYRAYLQRQGISSLISYPKVKLISEDNGNPLRERIIALRQELIEALDEVLPREQAALAGGVLLGQRSALSPELKEAMTATGTSHLLAVSGQNVTILAGLVVGGLAWLVGRRQACLLALAAIAGYALLVGGQPSVLRAAVMGSLWVTATTLGRPTSGLHSLALAGAAMAAYDPQIVEDVSFQLSFAATLGLMTLAPILSAQAEAWLSERPEIAAFPLTRPVVETSAITLAAIALTLPIVAINFGTISLIAPLANLFAIPAFLAVAVSSAIAAALASVVPGLAPYLVWLAWPPAAYMTGVVKLFSSLPFASLNLGKVETGHTIAYYLALVASAWWLAGRRPQLSARIPVSVGQVWPLPALGVAVLLSLISVVSWLALTAPGEGRLSVTFLNVGQGDAILIRTPTGHNLLLDGGPSGEAALAGLSRNLPFDERRLDAVLLSHPQADHMTGLVSVLENYDVKQVMASPLEAESVAFAEWQRAIKEERASYYPLVAGSRIALGKGAVLETLNPP